MAGRRGPGPRWGTGAWVIRKVYAEPCSPSTPGMTRSLRSGWIGGSWVTEKPPCKMDRRHLGRRDVPVQGGAGASGLPRSLRARLQKGPSLLGSVEYERTSNCPVFLSTAAISSEAVRTRVDTSLAAPSRAGSRRGPRPGSGSAPPRSDRSRRFPFDRCSCLPWAPRGSHGRISPKEGSHLPTSWNTCSPGNASVATGMLVAKPIPASSLKRGPPHRSANGAGPAPGPAHYFFMHCF